MRMLSTWASTRLPLPPSRRRDHEADRLARPVRERRRPRPPRGVEVGRRPAPLEHRRSACRPRPGRWTRKKSASVEAAECANSNGTSACRSSRDRPAAGSGGCGSTSTPPSTSFALARLPAAAPVTSAPEPETALPSCLRPWAFVDAGLVIAHRPDVAVSLSRGSRAQPRLISRSSYSGPQSACAPPRRARRRGSRRGRSASGAPRGCGRSARRSSSRRGSGRPRRSPSRCGYSSKV